MAQETRQSAVGLEAMHYDLVPNGMGEQRTYGRENVANKKASGGRFVTRTYTTLSAFPQENTEKFKNSS